MSAEAGVAMDRTRVLQCTVKKKSPDARCVYLRRASKPEGLPMDSEVEFMNLFSSSCDSRSPCAPNPSNRPLKDV